MRAKDGRLDWAVIPAAGRGTRLRAVTSDTPKVLLPVGGRPMLDWAVEEAVSSGADEIVVVVSPDQPQVERYVELSVRPNTRYAGARFHVVAQPVPAGIGDALVRCRPLTGDAPFGVVVPDNWFAGDEPALAFVGACRAETGLDTIGLVEVTAEEAPRLGNVGRVELEPLGGDGVFRIRRLGDKAPGTFELDDGEATLRGCARYALNPSFYDALEQTGPPQRGEWDDVPAFQRLAASSALAGGRIPAKLYDVGQPAGYRAAAALLGDADDQR